MNLKEASFFKIILRDSDDFIPLSSTFTKKYMEKSNETQTIVLRTNSSTAEWNVKYLKIDDKYYFMDGWLKFMKDNGLQMGDLLVFWLVSHSPTVFNIFFYAPNSCLKNPSSCSSGNIDPAMPKVGLGLGGEEKETSIEEVPAYDVSPLTNVFEKATGIGCYDTLLLKNKEGKKWKVEIKKYKKKNQMLYITKGWAKFMKDNKVEIGDRCEFKHVEGKLIRVHVFKKRGRPLGNKSNNGD
uniref:putative B3 domain-containing protein REM15 n=1 Tax=Erigeron canadensis TaxID=72917 RepID=UPI001CB91C46|nr:putative B3 domain-containing protein REM15 [Erigeron canadensis]